TAFCTHRDLPSFPTRRSSDLVTSVSHGPSSTPSAGGGSSSQKWKHRPSGWRPEASFLTSERLARDFRPQLSEPVQHHRDPRPERSEEHTSELQSLRHLVCRLL